MSLLSTICVAFPQLPADPKLVYLHAAVTTNDRSERSITGAKQENFKVLEDNRQQKIVYFSDTNPFSVGIVVDGSRQWRDLVKAVVPPVLMQNQSSSDEIFAADSQDQTNEALYQAANRLLREARNTLRVLILFTDRADPGLYSYAKLRDLMKDKEFELYIVSVLPSARSSAPSAQDPTVLRELAELSGGKFFSLDPPRGPEGISQQIAVDLRNQYRLGYQPTNSVADGTWRKIKITVEFTDQKTKKVNKARVRTRSGYYAPVVPAAVSGTK
jgi:Ca-activated chloride channel family protein